METVNEPCSNCISITQQNVRYSFEQALDEFGDFVEVYKLLECAGCHSICLAKHSFQLHEYFETRYYPPPLKRKKPLWRSELPICGALFDEVYEAVRGGQYQLAAMGVRALLEQVMISKVGDQGNFKKHVDAFFKQGHISLHQRDQIDKILTVGHASTHRRFKPNESELFIALDIIENILSTIYIHGAAASEMAERAPARPKNF